MKRVCDECCSLILDEKDAIRANVLNWVRMHSDKPSYSITDEHREITICQECFDKAWGKRCDTR